MAGEPPALEATQLEDDVFVMTDTRGLPGSDTQVRMNRQQVSMALTGYAETDEKYHESWAVDRGYCIRLDGRLIPVATTQPELLKTFESRIPGRRISRRRATTA